MARLKSGEIRIKNKFSEKKIHKPFRSRINANYTEEDLERAIEAVMEGGRLTQVAKAYNIPTVTLYDNVKKRRLQEHIIEDSN